MVNWEQHLCVQLMYQIEFLCLPPRYTLINKAIFLLNSDFAESLPLFFFLPCDEEFFFFSELAMRSFLS